MTEIAYGLIDTPYTKGFYPQQSPIDIRTAAALRGVPVAPISDHFRYCDLGCGFGSTISIFAASYPRAEFVGVDYNKEHIAYAKDQALRSGLSNVEFIDDPFADLASRNFEKFDFMTMHGIYSWVNDAVCSDIFQFVQDFLKDDGLLYMSFNVRAGWGPYIVLKDLIETITIDMDGSAEDKIKYAIKFLDKTKKNKAPYLDNMPLTSKQIDDFKKEDWRYLAHEFLPSVWKMKSALEVADDMSARGMQFVSTSNFWDVSRRREVVQKQMPDLNYDNEVLKFENVYGLLSSQAHRSDVFGHAGLLYDPTERHYGHLRTVARVGQQMKGAKFPVRHPDVMRALVPFTLTGEYTIDEIVALPELSAFSSKQIQDCIDDLFHGHMLQPAVLPLDPEPASLDQPYRIASEFNRNVLDGHFGLSGPLVTLASPIIGNGVRMSPTFASLLLGGETEGADGAATYVWNRAIRSRMQIKLSQKKIQSLAEFRKAIQPDVDEYRGNLMRLLYRVGVVESA